MAFFKKSLLLIVTASMLLAACSQTSDKANTNDPIFSGEKVEKTSDEWKKLLGSEEYYILREQGTEQAFSGEFWDHKEQGSYVCGACGLKLFSSSTKFKSGTGWPSFYKPEIDGNVGNRTDKTHGWVRTEVVCNRCEGHLGHVFEDGPEPTGLRYCINSASLDFQPNIDKEH